MNTDFNDSFIYFGSEIKAFEDGKVGGYLVRFSDSSQKDLTGEYFTKSTYLGPADGNGADTLFHHSIPLKAELKELADHLFKPMKTYRDEIGIWAETVLDVADKYEKKVLELVKTGKLSWSSGSAGHMIRNGKDGEIKRWPIIEGSLTPMPAEPREKIIPIKSLMDEWAKNDPSGIKAQINALETIRDFEDFLRDAGGFSKSAAQTFMSQIKTINRRDSGGQSEVETAISRLSTESFSQLLKGGLK